MRRLIQCAQNDNEGVTIEQTVKAIKKAGFGGVFVQWYNKNLTCSKKEQVRLCRDNGLDIEFAHLGYEHINDLWLDGKDGDRLIDEYIEDLENLKLLGIELSVMHTMSSATPPEISEKGVNRLIRLFSAAKDMNVKIAVENLRIRKYFDCVFDNTSFDNVGVCLDAGHCHIYFNDDFDWTRYGNKILAVHLHDNDGKSDMHRLPFDGSVPWGLYETKLKACGFDKPVTLESKYSRIYFDIGLEEFYRLSYDRAREIAEALAT